mgnify:CR=1 FL=1
MFKIREYIYIPLGGNRTSTLKHVRNLFVVWLLTGLWHGASWNFVVWGLYYGFILLMEKMVLNRVLDKVPNFIKHIYTMVLVIIGWVFFGSTSLTVAIDYIKVMFGMAGHQLIDSTSLYYLYTNIKLFIILGVCATPIVSTLFSKIINIGEKKGVVFAVIYYFAFRFIITKFDLKTPGREDDDVEAEKKVVLSNDNFTEVAAIILEGVGGKDNVVSIDNCVTRLRLEVKDQALVNEAKIKSAGISGIIRPGKTSVQVIVGTKVQFVADEFKKLCK